MKRNVIITASDKKYGDFLIEHWLNSLMKNVDLRDIDVCVLDYGLSEAQKFFLEEHDVKLFQGVRDGHVVMIRFRDIEKLLLENNYDQVLICDGGDIIFQSDISNLFAENIESYRAVCEDNKSAFNPFLTEEFFSKDDKKKILNCLLQNPIINAGFVLAPREKMIYLSQKINEMVKNKKKFGPDQVALNFILRNEGFCELDKKYNFVIPTANEEIVIKNGIFYLQDGKKISVVHNSGNINFWRLIKNFGYGENCNAIKKSRYLCTKTLFKSTDNFYRSQEKIRNSQRRIRNFLKKIFMEV